MVILYCCGKKAFETLTLLNESYYKHIQKIVIATDRSIEKDYFEEIKKFCQNKNISFEERINFSGINNINIYHIAIGWRWLLPVSNDKLIVFHDSLLPKYRGFAPTVNALINGEKKLGVTALFGHESYDQGEIIKSESVTVDYPIKINDAFAKIGLLYGKLINFILKKIANSETIKSTPQNENNASYSIWRNEEDYKINWNSSAEQIKRFVDAVGFPYKGASINFDGKILRVLDVEIPDKDVKIESRADNLGKTIFLSENQPIVICKKGLVKLTHCIEDQTKEEVNFKKFRIRFK